MAVSSGILIAIAVLLAYIAIEYAMTRKIHGIKGAAISVAILIVIAIFEYFSNTKSDQS